MIVALLAALPAALLLAKRALVRASLPRDPARAARERVRSFAADQGLELGASLTPRELGAALERHFGVPAHDFAAALERSAYAAAGARDEAALTTATDGIVDALRHVLGHTRRLRGAFSLRALARGRGR